MENHDEVWLSYLARKPKPSPWEIGKQSGVAYVELGSPLEAHAKSMGYEVRDVRELITTATPDPK